MPSRRCRRLAGRRDGSTSRPEPAIGQEPDPRFTFANERTFLAWNRTALGLIAGALVAHQILDFEAEAAELLVSIAPIVLAAGLAVVAHRRYEENQHALRLGEPLPTSSMPGILTVGMLLLTAAVAFVLAVEVLAT